MRRSVDLRALQCNESAVDIFGVFRASFVAHEEVGEGVAADARPKAEDRPRVSVTHGTCVLDGCAAGAEGAKPHRQARNVVVLYGFAPFTPRGGRLGCKGLMMGHRWPFMVPSGTSC
ncbi:MAG: hypothetical protein ABL916_22990 [Burkholderiaceae bacterium]